MFKIIILSVIGMSLMQVLPAQTGYGNQFVPSSLPDSVDLAYYGRKRLGQSVASVIALNLGVWSFDRYVRKRDFASISLRTVRENFKQGFVWDNDNLGTNMFFHPYHGNLYFNAARSGGYNFWQSGLFALGGSAMWELLMENEYPSTNDIIATPIGGLALGETLYRVSDIVLDDRAIGCERMGREMAVFILSPMRGLIRIINGDAWKRRPTSRRQFGIPDARIALSMGVRVLELEEEILDRGVGIASEIDVEYGDRFNIDREKPYDFFTMKVGLNVQKSQPLLGQVNLVGRLFNRVLLDSPERTLNIGLYQHFDFYDSEAVSDVSSVIPYKIAIPASVGGGLQFQRRRVGNWDFSASIYGNGILMGAVLSDHYRLADRNYNMANGWGAKSRLSAVYKKNKFSVSLSNEYYRLFTWNGYGMDLNWALSNPKILNVQGDESQSSVYVSELRLEYRLKRRVFVTGSFMHFRRDTDYRYYPEVESSTISARLMLTCVL